MLNWIFRNRTVWSFNYVYTKCVHKSNILGICKNGIWHKIANNARGVIVIVAGNEHGDTISNPGRDWLHFT